jgi:hypothetical protein
VLVVRAGELQRRELHGLLLEGVDDVPVELPVEHHAAPAVLLRVVDRLERQDSLAEQQPAGRVRLGELERAGLNDGGQ